MMASEGARFTVYAGFRRGRLVLRRGLPTLERAIDFAESVARLRFRNREPLFVVDDSTREIVWQGPGPEAIDVPMRNARAVASKRVELVPEPASAEPEPASAPNLAASRRALPPSPPPPRSSGPTIARLSDALGSARRAIARCDRTLSERIAPLSASRGEGLRSLAAFAARLHEQGRQLTDSFARSISLLEQRLDEQRTTNEMLGASKTIDLNDRAASRQPHEARQPSRSPRAPAPPAGLG